MKNRIAYCGLNCEKCYAYSATINDDKALCEKNCKKKGFYMKRKSLILLLLSLLLTICLAGCTLSAHEYYDDNAKIIKYMDSHSTISSVTNNTAEKFSLTASQFDGCVKLKALNVAENAVLDISLSLESGLMKLVAIPKGTQTVIVVAEVTKDNPSVASPVQSTLAAGEYVFALVADLSHKAEFIFNY